MAWMLLYRTILCGGIYFPFNKLYLNLDNVCLSIVGVSLKDSDAIFMISKIVFDDLFHKERNRLYF